MTSSMNQPHQALSTQRGRPRQRSAVACTWCHSRRVKCNAAANGTPCSNCETTGRHCMLIESRRGKKRKLSTSPSIAREHSYIEPQTPGIVAAHGNVYDPLRDIRAFPKTPADRVVHKDSTSTSDHEKPDAVQEPQETLYTQVLDKATNAGADPELRDGVVHVMYMGETFNLTHLLRQTNPESVRPTRKRHYVVRFNPRSRKADAVEDECSNDDIVTTLLQQQGALTVPDVHTCSQLFRTYFEFVHPHYPILDRADFAFQYADPTNPPSYLLLQSILFMAAGHCDLSVLLEAGFNSRYHARKTFFQRAKALYDNDHEPNKVTIVQSVFLMSFWWNGPMDQKDTWHWLGIAISLALTLGMHRSTQHSDMKARDRSLWKKIWWTLFTEEKHAATALGRPVHIRRVDCDVELLDRTDFEEQPVSRPEIFVTPERVDGLYVMALVELSFIAERIVHSSFTAFNSTTSNNTEMFHSCSEALDQWRSRLPPELQMENSSTCLWTSMLHIAHCWFEIVTHRSITPQNLSPPSMKTAHTLAMDAANRMVRIVEGLLSQSHILHCPIHIVPALFAAMGMQAVDICSGQSILEQLAAVKVRLAMIALRELQSTWPVSGWIFRLFSKIVRRIRNGDEFCPNEPVNASPIQVKPTSMEEGMMEQGQFMVQPPLVSDKPQYQDPSLTQPMYAVPNNIASRYLFPENTNLAMPLSYPADWQSILDDGAWGDFEYEF
ncbi:fungal-specific transcription factor domain-containing protein [Exophiala viscosa]|uniref:fungal-specific transcription factor domain-containing protein n=1 Tax=Exophiala viscosa TaxID=2486360 RepID=UPI00219C0BC5|nr:fungal-specific transcription factor domain-containing protein [Exophiala viscosa]